ncbi:hypothetical protein GGU11DRAFT_751051 [Lentinula aff. detonsa]|nr:hypothetical protein GGU11DRAFT_751051 [Lentinula aff. detonsa]
MLAALPALQYLQIAIPTQAVTAAPLPQERPTPLSEHGKDEGVESILDLFGARRLSGWQAGLARGGIAPNESIPDSFGAERPESQQTSLE